MKTRIEIKPAASRQLAKFQKDDPAGIDQVMDSVNLLRDNSHPPGAVPMSSYLRIHVGIYRVLYQVKRGRPVVVSVENAGRVP